MGCKHSTLPVDDTEKSQNDCRESSQNGATEYHSSMHNGTDPQETAPPSKSLLRPQSMNAIVPVNSEAEDGAAHIQQNAQTDTPISTPKTDQHSVQIDEHAARDPRAHSNDISHASNDDSPSQPSPKDHPVEKVPSPSHVAPHHASNNVVENVSPGNVSKSNEQQPLCSASHSPTHEQEKEHSRRITHKKIDDTDVPSPVSPNQSTSPHSSTRFYYPAKGFETQCIQNTSDTHTAIDSQQDQQSSEEPPTSNDQQITNSSTVSHSHRNQTMEEDNVTNSEAHSITDSQQDQSSAIPSNGNETPPPFVSQSDESFLDDIKAEKTLSPLLPKFSKKKRNLDTFPLKKSFDTQQTNPFDSTHSGQSSTKEASSSRWQQDSFESSDLSSASSTHEAPFFHESLSVDQHLIETDLHYEENLDSLFHEMQFELIQEPATNHQHTQESTSKRVSSCTDRNSVESHTLPSNSADKNPKKHDDEDLFWMSPDTKQLAQSLQTAKDDDHQFSMEDDHTFPEDRDEPNLEDSMHMIDGFETNSEDPMEFLAADDAISDDYTPNLE